MKLNHLNLTVADVAVTRAFFEKFFGMRCAETKGDDVLSVLVDEAGFTIVLSNFDRKFVPEYPLNFHLGFIQDSVDKVNELYGRFKEAGVDVPAPGTSHGSWAFYVTAPGGFLIEISSYENAKTGP